MRINKKFENSKCEGELEIFINFKALLIMGLVTYSLFKLITI